MIRLLVVLLMLAVPALAAEPNPSFNLVNHAGQPIRALHLSPAGHATFGSRNWLAGPLPPGNKVAIRLPADGNCVFDLRATFADNSVEDRRLVNTCNAEDVVFAPAKAANDPSFTLVNHMTQPIAELSATPTGQPRGANLLTAPIAPQGRQAIKLANGACAYDVRLVFADKSAKERHNVDLCKLAELAVP